jgi:hypothetical protein
MSNDPQSNSDPVKQKPAASSDQKDPLAALEDMINEAKQKKKQADGDVQKNQISKEERQQQIEALKQKKQQEEQARLQQKRQKIEQVKQQSPQVEEREKQLEQNKQDRQHEQQTQDQYQIRQLGHTEVKKQKQADEG